MCVQRTLLTPLKFAGRSRAKAGPLLVPFSSTQVASYTETPGAPYTSELFAQTPCLPWTNNVPNNCIHQGVFLGWFAQLPKIHNNFLWGYSQIDGLYLVAQYVVPTLFATVLSPPEGTTIVYRPHSNWWSFPSVVIIHCPH